MASSVTAAQVVSLRRMTDEYGSDTFTDDELTAAIEAHAITDELGTDPYHLSYTPNSVPTKVVNTDWIPTFDVRAAAADIWEQKAAMVASKVDFSADGGSYSVSQEYTHAMNMVSYYRSRRSAKTINIVSKS